MGGLRGLWGGGVGIYVSSNHQHSPITLHQPPHDRLDYTVRALRLHEQELVDEAYAKQVSQCVGVSGCWGVCPCDCAAVATRPL